VRSIVVMFLVGATACFAGQTISESYSVLLKSDGHTWCAYKDSEEFKSEAAAVKPTESARVSYLSSKLTELTYQIEAESGDWIVIDKYTPSDVDVLLRRANLLVQENLQIIQETVIHGGKADAFHLVSVTTLDGKKAELPANIDFPSVPVKSDLLATPFMRVISEMRRRSAGKLCN
jgi:hypothetical protein